MSKNKTKQNAEKAEAFLAENKNVNIVYFTSDGQMFRAEHYANSWAASLKDREIDVHIRSSNNILDKFNDKLKTESAASLEDAGSTGNGDSNSDATSDDDERKALEKEHIELFDTKPAYNIGLDKLKAKIAEKKAELEAESHIVTGEDLTNNPELTEAGIKAGDEVGLPNTEK